jgi:hypothetical protein
MAYREGVPELEAVGMPPSDDAVWLVVDLEYGATIGPVAEPGKCRSLADAEQQAVTVYGPHVGAFRVERIR